MSYLSNLKTSCKGSNNDISSKRMIMYHFVYASLFMILIQASFTLILIYKWAKASPEVNFEVYSVFPDVIWYCVFGCITGLAGINGFGKQTTNLKPPKEEDVI